MKNFPKKLEMSHLLFFVIGFLVCMLVNSPKVIEGLNCFLPVGVDESGIGGGPGCSDDNRVDCTCPGNSSTSKSSCSWPSICQETYAYIAPTVVVDTGN